MPTFKYYYFLKCRKIGRTVFRSFGGSAWCRDVFDAGAVIFQDLIDLISILDQFDLPKRLRTLSYQKVTCHSGFEHVNATRQHDTSWPPRFRMSRFREWDLSCKVYVGNLGSSASKYEIERVFCKYGPIRNVWVARNPPGFAFVEFEDSRDAEDSVRGLDGT
jgi:hypothetical protein